MADGLYGASGDFLDALEGMHQNYVVEVKKNTLVWTVDPATLPGKTPGPSGGRNWGPTAITRSARCRKSPRTCPRRPGSP